MGESNSFLWNLILHKLGYGQVIYWYNLSNKNYIGFSLWKQSIKKV